MSRERDYQRENRILARMKAGTYTPPTSTRHARKAESQRLHEQHQERAFERKVKAENETRVNRLYSLLLDNGRASAFGLLPAKIVTTKDHRLTLRQWKNGRGAVVYEGDSMTLSDALDLVQCAMDSGFYIVNPEVFEGAYEL